MSGYSLRSARGILARVGFRCSRFGLRLRGPAVLIPNTRRQSRYEGKMGPLAPQPLRDGVVLLVELTSES